MAQPHEVPNSQEQMQARIDALTQQAINRIAKLTGDGLPEVERVQAQMGTVQSFFLHDLGRAGNWFIGSASQIESDIYSSLMKRLGTLSADVIRTIGNDPVAPDDLKILSLAQIIHGSTGQLLSIAPATNRDRLSKLTLRNMAAYFNAHEYLVRDGEETKSVSVTTHFEREGDIVTYQPMVLAQKKLPTYPLTLYGILAVMERPKNGSPAWHEQPFETRDIEFMRCQQQLIDEGQPLDFPHMTLGQDVPPYVPEYCGLELRRFYNTTLLPRVVIDYNEHLSHTLSRIPDFLGPAHPLGEIFQQLTIQCEQNALGRQVNI